MIQSYSFKKFLELFGLKTRVIWSQEQDSDGKSVGDKEPHIILDAPIEKDVVKEFKRLSNMYSNVRKFETEVWKRTRDPNHELKRVEHCRTMRERIKREAQQRQKDKNDTRPS